MQESSIRSRKWISQIKDFSGLKRGSIMPTDIDAFIEYKGVAYVFMEGKHVGSEMPFAQKLALERLCDDCQDRGKEALLMVVSHDTDGDIDYANTKVVMTRHKYRWTQREKDNLTAKDMMTMFLDDVDTKLGLDK